MRKSSYFWSASGYDRKLRRTKQNSLNTSTTIGLSSHKVWMFKSLLYLRSRMHKLFQRGTGNGRPEMIFDKIKKTPRDIDILFHSRKFHKNLFSHLWEILWTKKGKKKNNNKKHYNHYKVFRWKRKTLIKNLTITIRSSVGNGRP